MTLGSAVQANAPAASSSRQDAPDCPPSHEHPLARQAVALWQCTGGLAVGEVGRRLLCSALAPGCYNSVLDSAIQSGATICGGSNVWR